MHTVTHRRFDELVAALDEIRRAPADNGTLAMIVRRPAVDQREVLNEGQLDLAGGLVGDNWKSKPSSRTPDHSPHPDMQLNLMNARVIDLIAGVRERWALAGDQLFVDLDLSAENLPAGTRLRIGTAVIEVTSQPHTGCAKFVERFGLDALKFVNSPDGRRANLRGINARVAVPGTIRVGDRITKEPHGGH
jgi:MOSC domain-containing protein YiiM